MVGVPRSKGCLTCRRRKVACDQGKPFCENCLKRGVTCEGYAKHPVVLQWTPTGLKKRERFEEASGASQSAQVSRSASPAASSATPAESSQPLNFNNSLLIPREASVGPFVLEQIEIRCLETYLPRDGSAVEELKTNWMYSMISIATSDPGRALSSSFAALCLARTGIVRKDDSLIARGREQYQIGLNALQYALNTSELAFQDRTLAAIRTLSIYELFALPFTSMSAAHVHEAGMTQWLLSAGPRSINSEFALQVFHDVRWCIMNRDIEQRKSSILIKDEWKTLPWQNFYKDSLQELFDIGFDVAALLASYDKFSGGSPHPERSVARRAQAEHNCFTVREQLQAWYSGRWLGRRIEDDTPPSSPGSLADKMPQFASFWEATNMIYYWLFNMLLTEVMSALLDEEQMEGKDSNTQLATNIVCAAPYFLSEDTGWLGPQRLFFPIRKAMEQLGKMRSPWFPDAKEALLSTVGRLRAC